MTSREPPHAVEVSSRWDAIFEPRTRPSLERVLPAYIAARRWYRTKTKKIERARVVAAFPLSYAGAARVARIALVELELEDDTRDTYVLPLAFVTGDAATRIEARRPHALVLPLRVTGDEGRSRRTTTGYVVDALVLDDVLAELLRAIARGDTTEDAGQVLGFHPLAAVLADDGRAPLSPRLVEAEQTNTSVFFGDRFVGKVLRKLDPGESPDLEMVRFLTDNGYAHVPEASGWIDVRERGGAAGSTVALLQAFAPNRGDAWAHLAGVLDRWLARAVERGCAPPALAEGDLLVRASAPLSPDLAALVGDYGALAELLGRRIGEMHAVLASGRDEAFRPEPLDDRARAKIASAVRADLSRAIVHVSARAADLSSDAGVALRAVRARLPALEQWLEGAVREAEGGVRIRVHGDLHLGQVLFTGNDFVIIDFEGEPARSLEERRSKRSVFVDVAGMLRSYHYAVVSAVRAKPETRRRALIPWGELFYRAVTGAFLRGWLRAARDSVLVPRSASVTRALLDLFLVEKAVYELNYELDNRPDWVDIPLEGLRELMEREIERTSTTTGSSASATGPIALDAEEVRAFHEGRAMHADAVFGAHPCPDRPDQTDFAVWAPNALSVAVIGDHDAWTGTPLERVADTGVFAARVRGVRVGDRYKYRVVSPSGAHDKADPFAYAAEVAPKTASIVASLDEHVWRDDAWMAARARRSAADQPISVYEVHLGSWRWTEAGRPMTYREIAEPLAAHAREMGFSHVQLMPVLEHPADAPWGYEGTGYFAPTSRYGTPTDLMCLVATLHEAGVGVLFDWVPGRFARSAHGLAAFDGGPTFEPADPARAAHPAHGALMMDLARPEVRSFLLSSAMFLLERYHADGLRIDGLESMLYRDHLRAPGTWTPHDVGGRESLEGIAFLRELTTAIKRACPDVLLVADGSSWAPSTRPVGEGGLGLDWVWDTAFSRDMRRYLALDPLYRSQRHAALTRALEPSAERAVLAISHGDVSDERGGALLDQVHGDEWQRFANVRLLYATMYAKPGKKLLFMGCEWAAGRAWRHDRALDWDRRREREHDGVARLVTDLNRLQRDVAALHERDGGPAGFEWIDASNADMSVVTFLRRGAGDDAVIVALNFTPVPRQGYRVGVPRVGRYREILNSDAAVYGGSGHGNLGAVEAVPYPHDGRPCSVVVTLPPLGAIFLRPEPA